METGMSLKWKGWGDRGGWEDWKNTGGFTWKTWMDKVDTWMDKVDTLVTCMVSIWSIHPTNVSSRDFIICQVKPS